MIKIKKSHNADTRTAVGEVSEKDLLDNSISHIKDVQNITKYFSIALVTKLNIHDYTKIKNISQFHADFENTRHNGANFIELPWYKNHITEERHHLSTDNFPADVNMFDIIEMIIDNVAAGMARSGEIRQIPIPNEILQKAVQNTAELLKNNIEIIE